MKKKIVETSGRVLLVGGGAVDPALLRAAGNTVSQVVAADGGARALLEVGLRPDAVIGDMDSLGADAQAKLPDGVLHPIAEQDSTDFDKCLRNISAPLVLAHGFLGARLDHQLAALTVLVRRADLRCVLIGDEDVAVLVPPALALNLPRGMRLSLYPMGAVRGQSQGLRWPIDGLDFAPDGRVGTSNEVNGPVSLTFDAPRMLLILPLGALSALEQGLAQAAQTWPAPA